MVRADMIAVTFALPQESRAFIATRKRRDARKSKDLLVVHTGIGIAAAEGAVRAFLAEHQPVALIAAGFAGALDARLRTGDAIIATNSSAPALLARCRERWKDDPGVCFGALSTAERVAESAAAKAQLARESGACAVDMETSAIEALCREASVPLLALRVISDAADAPLPLPFSVSYDLATQRPRPLAVAAYLARNPQAIRPLVRFVRGLKFARNELARRLEEILPEICAAARVAVPD